MTQPTLQLTTNKNLASVKNITIRDSGNKEVLEAYLLDHEGQPYNLENKTVTFMENKIGDKFVSDSNVQIVNPNAGQIRYTLQSQVHSASGIAWFEINDSSGLVDSTANFNIRVEDGLRATADNTTYIDALEKLKRQMETLIQQADGELKAELQKAEQQLNQELQNFRTQYNSLSADFQNQFKTAQNARQQDYNNQKNAINQDWTNNKNQIWGQWNDDKASIDKQAQDTIQAIKDNAKQVLDKDQADWNAKQKQWDSTFSAIVKEWQVKTNSLNATVQDLTNKFNTIIGQVSDLMDNKLPAMDSKTDAVQAKVDELRASLGQIDWTSFARKTDTTSGGVNIIPFAKDFKNLRHWELNNANDPNGTLTITQHSFYQNGARNLLQLSSHKHSVNMDQYEVFARSDVFQVKPHTTYTFSMEIFGDTNVSNFDVFFLGYNSYSKSSPNKDIFDNIHPLLTHIVPNPSRTVKYTATFTTDNDVEGYIRIDNNGANKDNVIASLYICWVKLEEGTQATTENRSQDDYYDKYDIDTRISNVTSVEAFETLKNSVLLKKGDNMQKGSWITWNGSSANSATDGHLGGIQWTGATDTVRVFGDNNQADNLDLAIQLGDDNSNHISIRDKDGTERATITADGKFTGRVDWNNINKKPNIATKDDLKVNVVRGFNVAEKENTGATVENLNNPQLVDQQALLPFADDINSIKGQGSYRHTEAVDLNTFTGRSNQVSTYILTNMNNKNYPVSAVNPKLNDPRGTLIVFNFDNNAKTQLWIPVSVSGFELGFAWRYWEGNNPPAWKISYDLYATRDMLQDLSDRLSGFMMTQSAFQRRVDYSNPAGNISDTTVNLNDYRETGILKLTNCYIQNGPYKTDNPHWIFVKITAFDGNTAYQTIDEGDNMYKRKFSSGGWSKWFKYENQAI